MKRVTLFAFVLLSTAWADDGDVSLVGGENQYSGAVQIEYGGKNGAVCNDKWNVYAADVVCKDLFETTSMTTAHYAMPGSINKVFLDNVDCKGDESRLMDCVHGQLGQSSCQAENSAGVICWDPLDFQTDVNEGMVFRLAGGPTSVEGRVEVFTNSSWGSVCDERWSSADAEVSCRQLGCKRDSSASSGSRYGPGVLGIVWTNVECSGTEQTLSVCPKTAFDPEENTTCSHETEAGASCNCGMTVTIGEGNTGNGVLNVIDKRGLEGSLCYDSVNLRTADVACREAGFLGALSTSPLDGASSREMLNVIYTCIGNEISLEACNWFNYNCTDDKEAAVVCQSQGEVGTPAGSTETTEPGGLSTGVIVAIVIVVLLVVVVVVVIAFWMCRKRRGPARY